MDNPGEWEDVECNKRLIAEVAEETGLKMYQIEQMLHHYSSFIARTIRSGSMEGVFVPYLGKFKVKDRLQQYRDYRHALHPAYRKLLAKSPSSQVNTLFEP